MYAEIQFVSIFNALSISYRARLFTKNSKNLIRTPDATTLQRVPQCYWQPKDVCPFFEIMFISWTVNNVQYIKPLFPMITLNMHHLLDTKVKVNH